MRARRICGGEAMSDEGEMCTEPEDSSGTGEGETASGEVECESREISLNAEDRVESESELFSGDESDHALFGGEASIDLLNASRPPTRRMGRRGKGACFPRTIGAAATLLWSTIG